MRVRDHLKNLLFAAVLGFLTALSGCSEGPPGLDLTFSLNLDPLGFGVSIKNPPKITVSGPDGFTLTATPTTAPASQPTTIPASQP